MILPSCARAPAVRRAERAVGEQRELAANQRQNLSDGGALEAARGLDVNVRFTSIDAFEYSEDQVTSTCSTCGSSTAGSPTRRTRRAVRWDADLQPADREADRVQLAAHRGRAVRRAASPRRRRRRRRAAARRRRRGEELRAALALGELSGASAPPKRRRAARGVGAARRSAALCSPDRRRPRRRRRRRRWRVGLAAEEWLDRSASQLAHHGPEQLHRHTSDGGRTSSSATTTSRRSSSTTALPARDRPRLPLRERRDLERLNQVDGDLLLCDREFGVIDPRARGEARRRAPGERRRAVRRAGAGGGGR